MLSLLVLYAIYGLIPTLVYQHWGKTPAIVALIIVSLLSFFPMGLFAGKALETQTAEVKAAKEAYFNIVQMFHAGAGLIVLILGLLAWDGKTITHGEFLHAAGAGRYRVFSLQSRQAAQPGQSLLANHSRRLHRDGCLWNH